MEKIEKYKCTSVTSCGEKSISFWEVKDTDKTIICKMISGYTNYSHYKVGDVLRLLKSNKCKHCLKYWEYGNFTAYPNRAGKPYHFEICK